ncbi:hypothetical protein ABZ897_42880 [Nonomuraea sp. NPDC046802]|uniref:hypothetical protein n=1 Tax=Nonomuraea sp. NPDC046802 TaxID=3154919 RepID=UPI0033F9B84F
MSRIREVEEARKRLAPKYGDEAVKGLVKQFGSFGLPVVEAVTSVAEAVRKPDNEDYMPTPTPEDVDDALLTIRGARVRLLRDELALIEAARANGRSWERIAELLCVRVSVAKARPANLRRAIEDLNRI